MLQRRIGLTGGIATGKTIVSRYLETTHNLLILDADVYARTAVEPGTPVLSQIVQRYGPQTLNPDGTLDRQRLGEIIFQNATERQWLEQQIHPQVRDRFLNTMQTEAIAQLPTIVLVIPLLFEAQMTDLVTEVWVVTCSADQQLAHLVGRDRLTVEQAQARINAQFPLSQKEALADRVLRNDSTLEHLYQQIDQALRCDTFR